jgi:hypothetical protein
MASYLLKEDGGKITLEDESGFLLLEEDGDEVARSRTGLYSHLSHMRRRARKCLWILFNLIGV